MAIFGISKLQILRIFPIEHFWNFPNWIFFRIFQIDNFSNFPIDNFRNLPNEKFSELFKLAIFRIFQIANFSNFLKCKFSEFFELKNLPISIIFSIRKTKIWLQKLAILELFVHSIFRITRNFANPHIFPLI